MAEKLFITRAIAALTVMIMLTGCSSVGFMHAMADDVIKSRVADILDLSDPDDERHVHETIDRFFAEATPTLAPAYADFLRDQADTLESGGAALERADIAVMIDEFRQLLRDSAGDMAPAVAGVLVHHTSPGRVEHLRKALMERREEQIEERQEGTPESRREDRIEQTVDNIERFIPNLTDQQIAQIALYIDRDIAEDDDLRFFEYTERRHEALTTFLAMQPDESRIATYMVRWMTEGPQLTDPAFVPLAEVWWEGRVDLYWSVVRLMSDTQRTETVRILRKYAGDVAALS